MSEASSVQRYSTDSRLDDVLPVYDINEVHTTWVPAPPERVYAAIRQVMPAEMRLVGVLMGLRALPERLLGRRFRVNEQRPFLDQLLAGGFAPLAEEENRELVVGCIGQFWKLRGGPTRRIESPQHFRSFAEPGFVVAAMNFRLQSAGTGTRLSTETRVRATDETARRKFRLYWVVVNLGSAAIRRDLLHAIKRRAAQA